MKQQKQTDNYYESNAHEDFSTLNYLLEHVKGLCPSSLSHSVEMDLELEAGAELS